MSITPIANLAYPTVQELARKLKEDYFRNLYVLPFNRFEVSRSDCWWLAPTPDKGAFRFGKLILNCDPEWINSNQVFCGFNVEKGLGIEVGDAKSVGLHAGHVMTPDWLWHQFVRELQGKFLQRIHEAVKTIGCELLLYVGCGCEGSDGSKLLLTTNGESLSVSSRLPGGDDQIDAVANAKNFEEFSAGLTNLTYGAPWHWVDLMIGTMFSLSSSGEDEIELCARLLGTFQGWCKDSTDSSE